MLAALFLLAIVATVYALRESARAEANFWMASKAVDESLSVVDRDPQRVALVGPDDPQLEALRRDLLTRAQRFYLEFIKQKPDSLDVREGLAYAHFRLGHINRSLDEADQATRQYTLAINQFANLIAEHPARNEYRQALGNAYNWLGETLREASGRSADAKPAYDRAVEVQQALHQGSPDNPDYLAELARTFSNRGILLGANDDPHELSLAKADFRQSIGLLEPLASQGQNPTYLQSLARSYNNLGSLVAGLEEPQLEEAHDLYERAVMIHEDLAKRMPDNRDFKIELVKFYNNIADVARERAQFAEATTRNRQALTLLEDLAQPAPMIGIDLADAHNLRGRIVEATAPRDAMQEYRHSLEMFQRLENDPRAWRVQEFHWRFGDLLVNLAVFSRERPNVNGLRALVSEATERYLAIARRIAESGTPGDAQNTLEIFEQVMPQLSERDRGGLVAAYRSVQPKLEERARLSSRGLKP